MTDASGAAAILISIGAATIGYTVEVAVSAGGEQFREDASLTVTTRQLGRRTKQRARVGPRLPLGI